MYHRHVVMNRFWIEPGYEDKFEEAFKSGEEHLVDYPGLLEYDLLKGEFDVETQSFPYVSYMIWNHVADLERWKKSVSFQHAVFPNHHLNPTPETFVGEIITDHFTSMRY